MKYVFKFYFNISSTKIINNGMKKISTTSKLENNVKEKLGLWENKKQKMYNLY